VVGVRPPERAGEKSRSRGHRLVSEEGNFNPLVWRCADCELTAISKTARLWREEECDAVPADT
jgi:hypothetical protein